MSLGPHEILVPCTVIHRPGVTCRWCDGTGQLRQCKICLAINCDGTDATHGCLNCDNSRTVGCPTCESNCYDEDEIACRTCKATGRVPCPACG